MTPVTLAIDAMGGDFGPPVTVPAAVQALTSDLCLEIFLVGPPTLLEPLLATADSRVRQRIHLCPSASVIASDAIPSQAIRHARGSSMYIALELMVNGKVDACLSGGNTGVLMGLAMLLLKPLPGIRRPALMTLLPYQHKKQTVVLDLGANLSADQEMLVQFALMGSVVAREILGIAKPQVALLNVGQESSKGPEAIRQAAKRLQQLPDIRYIGYLEGNDLLTGKTDVLVSDGFSGNIALKTMEGVVRLFLSLLQGSPHRPKAWWRRWVTQLIKQKLAVEFGPVNPDQYNGAFLLGLPGMVMKSHGAANQQAFLAAIEQTVITVQRQLPKRIVSQLATVLSRSDNA